MPKHKDPNSIRSKLAAAKGKVSPLRKGNQPNKSAIAAEKKREPRNGEGRPRQYDLNEVAIEMIKWAKNEENTNLCGFSADMLIPSTTVLKWVDENPEFAETYELVRDFLGRRRENRLSAGDLHVKAYDLNAMTYDAHLRREVRGQMAFETKLKSGSGTEVNPVYIDKFNALNEQLSRLQGTQEPVE